MDCIKVTNHGKDRMRKRCGINAKAVKRLAKIAYRKGLSIEDTKGSLNGYLQSLYYYNRTANNIRLYGEQVYIFCDDTLVTVLNTPQRYKKLINKLMRKKKHEEKSNINC